MYIQIRNISKIRHLISFEIATLLVNSFVLSKLDYCNSLLNNISQENLNSLQHVQNSAARLLTRKKKYDSASPLLIQLHWLPVQKRIMYKTCTIVFKSLKGHAPFYINNLLDPYVPNRQLRSSDDNTILVKPEVKYKMGKQSFYYAAPRCWNSLPRELRQTENLDTFKSRLKTYLFTL